MKGSASAGVRRRNDEWNAFASLPPDAQREVLDFIAFLRTRSTARETRAAARRSKLGRQAFIGMWHKRADMRDSTAWVRRVREQEWNAPRG